MVIVAYRAKPGRDAELLQLTRDHVPLLRRLGLATERPALIMRGQAGVLVEVFEWAEGGIAAAHGDAEVAAMWARYAEVCDYVPLAEIVEATDRFAEFEPVD